MHRRGNLQQEKQVFIPIELKNEQVEQMVIFTPLGELSPSRSKAPQRPRHWNISRGITFAQASVSIMKTWLQGGLFHDVCRVVH